MPGADRAEGPRRRGVKIRAIASGGNYAGSVVGRGEELDAVESFLERAGNGCAILVIEGDAGIGKTTLWQAGIRLAASRGASVLVARPAQAETAMALAGLADLFAAVDDDLLEELPLPQKGALYAALLRQALPSGGVDERALSAGALSLLRLLSSDGRLVVAVDDAHWLDSASGRVLAFALRRLESEPVGFLVTVRTGAEPVASFDRAADPERKLTLALGPMSVGALHEVIKSRSGISFPRPVVVKLAEACGGNPFYGLEIAAELARHPPQPGDPLPVPASLRELLESRIVRLPNRTREALLVVALLSRPTPELVEVDALEPAERARLVVIEPDRIRFSHPLLAGALHDGVSAADRLRVHRRLAAVVPDPEESARHLALGSTKRNESVARRLETAAGLAASRGAAQAAGELMELALALTPHGRSVELAERKVGVARYCAESGDLGRAQSLLEDVASSEPSGDRRARALAALAQIHFRRNSFGEAMQAVDQARREAIDPDLQIRLDLDIGFFLVNLGDFPGLELRAKAAAAAVTADTDRGLAAEALAVLTIAEFLCGRGLDEQRLDRSLHLEDHGRPIAWQMRPSFIAGCLYLYCGRPGEAVTVLDALRVFAIERGEEGVLPLHCFYLTWALVLRGDLRRAREVADSAGQIAALVGDPASEGAALTASALVHALDGSDQIAVGEALRAIQIYQELNWTIGVVFPSWALGLAYLTSEQPEAVDATLRPLAAMAVGIGNFDPGLAMFLPDQIEASIQLGRLQQAEHLLGWLEQQAHALERQLALALAGRCRALLHAASGDLDSAAAAAEHAVIHHDRIDVPFERARTLLVWGQVLRRRKERAQARRVLDEALDSFERVGAPAWARKTEAELARLGLRRTVRNELTPTEAIIATLAASGLSNREIAQQAFVTVKTVEANLTRVYRKLRVHSRVGLARALETSKETRTIT